MFGTSNANADTSIFQISYLLEMHFLILNFMTTFLQDYNNKLFFFKLHQLVAEINFI